MTHIDSGQERVARTLCGGALIAMLAAVPVAMSLETKRGFVLAKLAVGLPLAILATVAACLLWTRRGENAAWHRVPEIGFPMAIALLAMLSATSAVDWQAAWLGGFFRLEGAVAWIAYAGVYFATSRWIRSGGNPVRLVDAILVGSIAPAGYAIWQRTGLDFVSFAYGDVHRSAGTLGNPVFMGAYLALCLPLVLARLGMEDTRGRRGAFGLLGLLLLGALVATGSRGALIGLLAALVLLACHRACVSQSRRWLIGMACLLAAVLAALASVNLTDAGRAHARSSPSLSRFVFDADGQDPASRSLVARLAGWSAADEAFRQAPIHRKLVGYGPDVAHTHYYAHVPAAKIRAEDFRAEQVFDRVHADMLDVLMALGLTGVVLLVAMFGFALWRISTASFGCSSRGAAGCIVLAIAAATAGWIAGGATGMGASRWPLAGAGFAAGWLLATWGVAWVAAGRPVGRIPEEGKLVAGCGAAAVAYWIDAQVGLPVFSTRVLFFVLLACATTSSTKTGDETESRVDPLTGRAAFAVACAAALLSFVPVFGALQNPGPATSEWGRWVPPAVLLILGWSVAGGRDGAGQDGPGRWVAGTALLCAGIAAWRFHTALPSSESDWIGLRTAAEAMFPLMMWLSPFILLWLGSRAVTGGRLPGSRAVIGAGLVGLVCAAWPMWRLMSANVVGAGATRVASADIETRLKMLEGMLAWAPWEWQYRYAIVYEALPGASVEVHAGLASPQSLARFDRYLSLAESVARDGDIGESADPWRPFLMALPLQMRGLNALWNLDPDRVARASDRADALFMRAHTRFPVHPLILEHWIRLKIDRGEFTAAQELVDRLEALIPREPEAYLLRIELGRRTGDGKLVAQAIEAAKKALTDSKLALILNVVN